uniref:exodeoxyribonuclease III n=1 Tax=Astyanax mexicanus TaxID=7994 RepID=A0A8B9LZW1_ASTMX
MDASHVNKLCFLTWNVNGLDTALRPNRSQDPCRQKDLREEMNKADVVFFQETHIVKGQESVKKNFPGWYTHYTESEQAQKGVAIFIKKKAVTFEFKDVSMHPDLWIVLRCRLNGQLYTLACVYQPPGPIDRKKDQDYVLRGLSEYLQSNTIGLLVIGGDFNTVFSPFVDKKEPTVNQGHSDLLKELKLFMQSLQLVDVWRWKHNFKRFYTFYRNDCISRLDYFFVPGECLWRVEKCEIEDVPSNDHLPVSLHLNNTAVLPMYGPTPTNANIMTYFRYIQETQNFQESRNFKTEDITMAIKSLQVSETPRHDRISASVYKSDPTDPTKLQYLHVLYSRILDGSIDAAHYYFNVSIAWNGFHFFNVDYVILAALLAKYLDEVLESQSRSHQKPNQETHVSMIYFFHKVPESVERHVLEKALPNVDSWPGFPQALFRIIQMDGRSQTRLCQGCPLTPYLHTFLLKYAVQQHVDAHVNADPKALKSSDIRIHVYPYFVNVIVPKGSALAKPVWEIDGWDVRIYIATSLEHVF